VQACETLKKGQTESQRKSFALLRQAAQLSELICQDASQEELAKKVYAVRRSFNALINALNDH
jgi:hypothetical protein